LIDVARRKGCAAAARVGHTVPVRCGLATLPMTMSSPTIRPLAPEDYAAWRPLWDGYNAFYGRHGATALPEHITQTTWQRFFDAGEPVFALVAEDQGEVVGLAHALFHRSMTKIEPVCYLSDLFTAPALRGKGIGRALIEAVSARAKAAGAPRLYWLTHETNAAGRLLYDKVARHQGFIVYSRDL
jgi:GNAT superfamily N-acetyltransferase